MLKRVVVSIVIFSVGCILMGGCELMQKDRTVKLEDIQKLDYKKFTHVAIVVDDIEKASKAYSDLFGVEVPDSFMTEPWEKANTQYLGKDTKAKAKLAFFKIDTLAIELIEPVGGPSIWQDSLHGNGPGVHHLAFEVKDIDAKIRLLESNGMKLLQQGQWTDGNGGRYAYLDDGRNTGLMFELLENF